MLRLIEHSLSIQVTFYPSARISLRLTVSSERGTTYLLRFSFERYRHGSLALCLMKREIFDTAVQSVVPNETEKIMFRFSPSNTSYLLRLPGEPSQLQLDI